MLILSKSDIAAGVETVFFVAIDIIFLQLRTNIQSKTPFSIQLARLHTKLAPIMLIHAPQLAS